MTHRYLCHPGAGRGSSTVWHTEGKGCRVEGSFSQSILELPHENLMKKQQHWHLTQHASALMEMVKPRRPLQTPGTLLTPHENNIKKNIYTSIYNKVVLGLIHPRLCKKHRHSICPFMWKCAKKILEWLQLLSDLKVPDAWYTQRNSPERGIPKSTLNTNKPPDQVAQKSISPMHGGGTLPSYLVFSVKFHGILLGSSTAAPALLFPSLQFSIARSTCGSHLQELD